MTYLARHVVQVALVLCSCIAVYKLVSCELQDQIRKVVMQNSLPSSFNTCGPRIQLFSAEGAPCVELQEILAITGVEHRNDLESIVQATQKSFLRPAGKERWEISDDQYAAVESQLMPLFNKLELIDTLYPTHQHYDYVLWMGSLLASAEKRLLFLKELWQQGLRFDNLVILTGERSLIPEERDAIRAICQRTYSSEPEMMDWVYENTVLPQEMRQIPVTRISSVAAPGAHRATTPDTVRDWLKTNPVPGTVLIISSQPYTRYQEAVVRQYLPASFVLDSAGKKSLSKTPITTYLDNLARWIYQENQIIRRRS